ncbi:PepSY-like domain-containing protein [Phocaeicola vulgatus]|uniref:Putative beta-lactamase-inhibitor-like PepSY-like domain-containing protein n=1 Tax=Phocaeicola vulgatus TaxID=821 RepID=A0A3E4JRE7_PHOVU|nr:PepSY-like domain-containing protein [Phocaeicola vulgatus]RGJ89521.1 hypothetical protein DXD46_06480 [Phocaeicola vulgatus]
MRQTIIKSLLLLSVILTAASCDKDEKEIGYNALPAKAQQFIAQYFPMAECTRAVCDRDSGTTEYEAWLSDGTELDFDKQGEWTSVDCKFSALPSGILPEVIATDIAARYPESPAYKVEKQPGGYEIDIPGWELYYNYQGTFIRAERDW